MPKMIAVTLKSETEKKLPKALEKGNKIVDVEKLSKFKPVLSKSRLCSAILDKFVDEPEQVLEFLNLKK